MLEPRVIHEDNHLLVLNKPSGWLSQGDRTGDLSVVDWAKEYIRKKYDKPGNVFAGLPHRLDRPVSGALVICKTSKSLERMTRKFAEKKVSKEYWALSSERPRDPDGKLEDRMMKDHKRNISKVVRKERGSKLAVLSYSTVQQVFDMWLIRVLPETGRPHQIRVQLSHMGCPIVGDLKYGGIKVKHPEAIGLHARSIRFEHPVTREKVEYTAGSRTNPIMAKLGIENDE